MINPDCAIFDSIITIPDAAVIYGYAGSTAEEYANKYGRTFVSLSDEPAVKGDINGDGNADLQDAAAVLNIYAAQVVFPLVKAVRNCIKMVFNTAVLTAYQLAQADVCEYGRVNIMDLCELKAMLIKTEISPDEFMEQV